MSVDSTSLRVIWEPLSSSADENGIIIGYEVEYSSLFSSDMLLVNGTMVELVELEEYTEYSVRVAAHTTVGAGQFSAPVVATTKEDGEHISA